MSTPLGTGYESRSASQVQPSDRPNTAAFHVTGAFIRGSQEPKRAQACFRQLKGTQLGTLGSSLHQHSFPHLIT